MESQTQPSTQPYHDPRRIGINNSGLSAADASDVLCILHPGSHLAHKAVAAAVRSSPQHVLQNTDLLGASNDFGNDDDVFLAQHSTRDIALRMSSVLHDPCMGFCFGRNVERCDVILDERSISNVHFRIYLNKDAVLMLEDTSTNGTIVDEELLLSKQPHRCKTRRTLSAGSIIQTVTPNANEEARFIVRFPAREEHQADHVRKLAQYLAFIAQVERQNRAFAEAKAKGEQIGGKAALAQPILRLQDFTPAEPSKYAVASTSAGYSHGMQWNGGSTYNVVGQIGKGAFATVYKLTTKNDGGVFAAKELDKRRFMKNGILDMKVDNEMKIMKGLRHPNIVQYVDYHEHEQWIYIIMEYVPGGELSTFISDRGPMSEVMVKTVTRQMLHALDYLHRRKITHRDIKPDNILIASIDPLRVKLSDFGLSKVVNQETFLKTFCGTLLYCAPEVYPEYDRYKSGLSRKRRRLGEPTPTPSPYSQAVDTWSFGAVLYHVLCNNPPFMGRGDDKGAQMLRNIMTMEADFEQLRQCGVSEDGIDFISKLLNRDPAKRPTEKECLQHSWIVTVPDEDDFLEIELDDIAVEDDGLVPIEEADEDALDASQLNIQDDLGHLDFYEDDDDMSVDELAAEHYQSKRTKLEESRIEPGTREIQGSPDVRYPALPEFDGPRSGRLFGEISESALRSSGILGQNARAALAMTEGSHDEQMRGSNHSEGTSSGDLVDNHLLYPHTIPTPNNFGGSAPSLLGAEALVGQLHMESPGSAKSPVSTPNTNNPETPKTREASPGRSNQPPSSDTDSTPKYRRFNGQIDCDLPSTQGFDVNDSGTHYISSVSEMDQSGLPLGTNTRRDGGMSLLVEEIIQQAGAIDQAMDKNDVGADGGAIPVERDLDAVAAGLARTPESEASSQNQNSQFLKPYRCLGKVTSLPGSIADVKFRLEHRMTSWGRGSETTVRYPDINDTRIPAYGLEITFWKPNIEQKIKEKEDWLQYPDVITTISTKTSRNIWVNGVELRSETPEKDGFFYGKLYTGDIVTAYQHQKDKSKFLKLRVEIYHGLNTSERPEEEKPFVIERSRMKGDASTPWTR